MGIGPRAGWVACCHSAVPRVDVVPHRSLFWEFGASQALRDRSRMLISPRRLGPCRKLFGSRQLKQCPACLKHYSCHIALCQHLDYSTSCRHRLQVCSLRCNAAPGTGSKRADDGEAFLGATKQALGPLDSRLEAVPFSCTSRRPERLSSPLRGVPGRLLRRVMGAPSPRRMVSVGP